MKAAAVISVNNFCNHAYNVHVPRVNNKYIPYIARDTQCSISYTYSHAITSRTKSRSLESANDAKLVNKALSAKSTQIMHLERHKEPYNSALWTRKRDMYM